MILNFEKKQFRPHDFAANQLLSHDRAAAQKDHARLRVVYQRTVTKNATGMVVIAKIKTNH